MNLQEKLKFVIETSFEKNEQAVEEGWKDRFLDKLFLAEIEDAFTSLYGSNLHQVAIPLPLLKGRDLDDLVLRLTRIIHKGVFKDNELNKELTFNPRYSCRLKVGREPPFPEISMSNLPEKMEIYRKELHPYLILQATIKNNDFKWWVGNLVTQLIIGEEQASMLEEKKWQLVKMLLRDSEIFDPANKGCEEYFSLQAEVLAEERQALESFYFYFGYNIDKETVPVIDGEDIEGISPEVEAIPLLYDIAKSKIPPAIEKHLVFLSRLIDKYNYSVERCIKDFGEQYPWLYSVTVIDYHKIVIDYKETMSSKKLQVLVERMERVFKEANGIIDFVYRLKESPLVLLEEYQIGTITIAEELFGDLQIKAREVQEALQQLLRINRDLP